MVGKILRHTLPTLQRPGLGYGRPPLLRTREQTQARETLYALHGVQDGPSSTGTKGIIVSDYITKCFRKTPIKKSRVERRCFDCNDDIHIGDSYVYWAGMADYLEYGFTCAAFCLKCEERW